MITKEKIDKYIAKALEKMVEDYNDSEDSQVDFEHVGPLVYVIDGGYIHGAFDVSVLVDEI